MAQVGHFTRFTSPIGPGSYPSWLMNWQLSVTIPISMWLPYHLLPKNCRAQPVPRSVTASSSSGAKPCHPPSEALRAGRLGEVPVALLTIPHGQMLKRRWYFIRIISNHQGYELWPGLAHDISTLGKFVTFGSVLPSDMAQCSHRFWRRELYKA